MVGGEAAATHNLGRSSSASSSRFADLEFDPRVSEEELMPLNSSSDAPWSKLSVVIPALNEARNLPHVFSLLPPELHELIIVDAHSVDDTIAVARRLRSDVRIITQSRSGKGKCPRPCQPGELAA
jgi:cellulose synthase/poly-beta-1,6-N-acetylglucosamine synthase-like glycosyltransferase